MYQQQNVRKVDTHFTYFRRRGPNFANTNIADALWDPDRHDARKTTAQIEVVEPDRPVENLRAI